VIEEEETHNPQVQALFAVIFEEGEEQMIFILIFIFLQTYEIKGLIATFECVYQVCYGYI